MANNSTPQTPPPASEKPTAPPEAYAAFVRVYIKWMENDENEQIALVEQSVRSAARLHRGSAWGGNSYKYSYFGKKGSILYEAEFDEYVSEVWATFLERCNDVSQFAEYLQKDFDKYMEKYTQISQEQKYENIKIEFLEGVWVRTPYR